MEGRRNPSRWACTGSILAQGARSVRAAAPSIGLALLRVPAALPAHHLPPDSRNRGQGTPEEVPGAQTSLPGHRREGEWQLGGEATIWSVKKGRREETLRRNLAPSRTLPLPPPPPHTSHAAHLRSTYHRHTHSMLHTHHTHHTHSTGTYHTTHATYHIHHLPHTTHILQTHT